MKLTKDEKRRIVDTAVKNLVDKTQEFEQILEELVQASDAVMDLCEDGSPHAPIKVLNFGRNGFLLESRDKLQRCIDAIGETFTTYQHKLEAESISGSWQTKQ